jgi:hypothetical protein
MINKENIEAFLLDYLEGNLSEDLKTELSVFLSENPEYKDYLEELPELIAPEITLENKGELKKTLDGKPEVFQQLQGNNLELWSVASMENELTEKEKLLFDRIKSESKSINSVAQQFANTKLIPENKVVFRDKKVLYRTPLYVSFVRWTSIGVAVSLALFIVWQQASSKTKPTLSAGKKKEKMEIPQPKSATNDTLNDTVRFPLSNENKEVKSWNELVVKTENLNIQEKIKPIFQNPEFIAENTSSQDTTNHSSQSVENVGQELASSSNSVISNDIQMNSKSEERALTVTEFVSGKINNRVFGKTNPSKEEKYNSFGDKIANASGGRIQMGYDARSNKRSFRFKWGIFSIERKKSTKPVTNK